LDRANRVQGSVSTLGGIIPSVLIFKHPLELLDLNENVPQGLSLAVKPSCLTFPTSQHSK